MPLGLCFSSAAFATKYYFALHIAHPFDFGMSTVVSSSSVSIFSSEQHCSKNRQRLIQSRLHFYIHVYIEEWRLASMKEFCMYSITLKAKETTICYQKNRCFTMFF